MVHAILLLEAGDDPDAPKLEQLKKSNGTTQPESSGTFGADFAKLIPILTQQANGTRQPQNPLEWYLCIVHTARAAMVTDSTAITWLDYALSMAPRMMRSPGATIALDLSHRTRVKSIEQLGLFSQFEEGHYQSKPWSRSSSVTRSTREVKDRNTKRRRTGEVCYAWNAGICHQGNSCSRLHVCPHCSEEHILTHSAMCLQQYKLDSLDPKLRAMKAVQTLTAARTAAEASRTD